MISEIQSKRMLDLLVSSLPTDDQSEARAFLTSLMAECPFDMHCMTLPIAFRLMYISGWQQKMSVNDVLKFCLDRRDVSMALRTMRTKTIDPEAEYYAGAATALAAELGLELTEVINPK